MKRQSFLAALFFSFSLPVFAAVPFDEAHHAYPQVEALEKKQDGQLKWPGYCEIEVINDSYTDVRVYGTFDDGAPLSPFNIYTYEYPHYISLYYYGYCHSGMNLYIETWLGYPVYSGYTYVNTTLRIVPYMMKQQPKVEIVKKDKK